MRTKLRSKTGDIDLGRKRSKVEPCQSSGRRCKYRRRHANVTNTQRPERSFASRRTMYMAAWEWIGSALKRA